MDIKNILNKKIIENNNYRIISNHPCYNVNAMHKYGRLHLPVAPKCNIQCNYCDRRFDCVNESRPGVTSKVLKPTEAFEITKKILTTSPHITVIGIAGPGDPLYNKETFETLDLINLKYPNINLCISTNGLLLKDKINQLLNYNLKTITVTVNSIDSLILNNIISYVFYNNKKYYGTEASSLLIKNQIEGIKKAIDNNIIIKINTVYIPSINDKHIIEISKYMQSIGVYIMNIIPLIPQSKFNFIQKPNMNDINNIRLQCSKYIKQMNHCKQCRADACGYL